MAHVLILGMTESGKTTLARNLSAYYKHQNYGVLVLDPLCDPRWTCDFITDDQEEFLDVFWRSRRCIAFLDEGGESVGRYDTAMQQTATRGRHWGHSCHFIAQRATQLAPLVRDQCSRLFLFCSSIKDGKLLSEEFNKPELETCSQLLQGEHIHAVKFGKTIRVTQTAKEDTDNASNISSGRSGNGDPGVDPARSQEGRDGSDTGAGEGNHSQAAGVAA